MQSTYPLLPPYTLLDAIHDDPFIGICLAGAAVIALILIAMIVNDTRKSRDIDRIHLVGRDVARGRRERQRPYRHFNNGKDVA